MSSHLRPDATKGQAGAQTDGAAHGYTSQATPTATEPPVPQARTSTPRRASEKMQDKDDHNHWSPKGMPILTKWRLTSPHVPFLRHLLVHCQMLWLIVKVLLQIYALLLHTTLISLKLLIGASVSMTPQGCHQHRSCHQPGPCCGVAHSGATTVSRAREATRAHPW